MSYEGETLDACGLQVDLSEIAIVAVSGSGPNVCGHLILYTPSRGGFYFHVTDVYGYPHYMNASQYQRYLREDHKHEFLRRTLMLPDPRSAELYLESILSEDWTWGILPHNCVSFCEAVIHAGGGVELVQQLPRHRHGRPAARSQPVSTNAPGGAIPPLRRATVIGPGMLALGRTPAARLKSALVLFGTWLAFLLGALALEHTSVGRFMFHRKVATIVYLVLQGLTGIAALVACLVILFRGSNRHRLIVIVPTALLVLYALVVVGGPG